MYFADTQYVINPLTDYLSPSKLSVSKLAHFVMATVLQYGQFAALGNKDWSLNFLQILMIFCNKNHKFCEFLTNFQLKMAKMLIFKA